MSLIDSRNCYIDGEDKSGGVVRYRTGTNVNSLFEFELNVVYDVDLFVAVL